MLPSSIPKNILGMPSKNISSVGKSLFGSGAEGKKPRHGFGTDFDGEHQDSIFGSKSSKLEFDTLEIKKLEVSIIKVGKLIVDSLTKEKTDFTKLSEDKIQSQMLPTMESVKDDENQLDILESPLQNMEKSNIEVSSVLRGKGQQGGGVSDISFDTETMSNQLDNISGLLDNPPPILDYELLSDLLSGGGGGGRRDSDGLLGMSKETTQEVIAGSIGTVIGGALSPVLGPIGPVIGGLIGSGVSDALEEVVVDPEEQKRLEKLEKEANERITETLDNARETMGMELLETPLRDMLFEQMMSHQPEPEQGLSGIEDVDKTVGVKTQSTLMSISDTLISIESILSSFDCCLGRKNKTNEAQLDVEPEKVFTDSVDSLDTLTMTPVQGDAQYTGVGSERGRFLGDANKDIQREVNRTSVKTAKMRANLDLAEKLAEAGVIPQSEDGTYQLPAGITHQITGDAESGFQATAIYDPAQTRMAEELSEQKPITLTPITYDEQEKQIKPKWTEEPITGPSAGDLLRDALVDLSVSFSPFLPFAPFLIMSRDSQVVQRMVQLNVQRSQSYSWLDDQPNFIESNPPAGIIESKVAPNLLIDSLRRPSISEQMPVSIDSLLHPSISEQMPVKIIPDEHSDIQSSTKMIEENIKLKIINDARDELSASPSRNTSQPKPVPQSKTGPYDPRQGQNNTERYTHVPPPPLSLSKKALDELDGYILVPQWRRMLG